MEFSNEILKQAAQNGSNEVSKAFSKLSGENVIVKATVAELISFDAIAEYLKPTQTKSVITYAQMISGTNGISILSIPREETLALIDLLNNQELGSTGVIMELDRSAVKETLNILSNSYLNALAKISGQKLIIGSPYMMTAESVEKIVEKIKSRDANEEKALLFKTSLEISKYQINAHLFLIFNEKFIEFINK